jgi:hypothetical protein
MALQNAEMRRKGVGWKSEACPDSGRCDEGLCVRDEGRNYWHPADPLAFAKWRVRAIVADIPPHVLVTQAVSGMSAVRDALVRRVAVIGAVGLTATAGILAVWIGRRGRTEHAVLGHRLLGWAHVRVRHMTSA